MNQDILGQLNLRFAEVEDRLNSTTGRANKGPAISPAIHARTNDRLVEGFYRALALRAGSATRILSRNQKDLGKKFPVVADSIAALDVQTRL